MNRETWNLWRIWRMGHASITLSHLYRKLIWKWAHIKLLKVIIFIIEFHQDWSSVLLPVILHQFMLMSLLHVELESKSTLLLRCLCFNVVVIVAIRAVFVGLLKILHVFSKDLFTLLTSHHDLSCIWNDWMVCNGIVTFRTIKPLFTARRSNCNLSI